MSYKKMILCFMVFYAILIASMFSLRSLEPDEGTYLLLGLFTRDITNFVIKNGFSQAYDFAINYLVYYPKLTIYYPPLYYTILGLAFNLVVSEVVGKAISLVFTLGIIYITYNLGKMLFNERVGFISGVLVGIMPMIMHLAGAVMTDNTMLFFFMSTMYFYLKAFKEDKRKYYILGAVSLALGFMTKWFILPVVPILFLYLIYQKKFKLMKKFILSLFLAGIILIPYLIFVIKLDIIQLVIRHSVEKFSESPYAELHVERHPPILTIRAWTFYFTTLIEQLSIIFFPICIISLFWISLKKEKNWKLILTWFLIVYVMLSLFQNKQSRYSITLIPAIILSASYMIEKVLTGKTWRNLFIVFLILLQLLVSLFVLPRYKYPLKEAVDFIYENTKGNIAFASEGNVFSSPFMFNMALKDKERSIVFYRNCNFFNKTEDEIQVFLKENNIYYILWTEEGAGEENLEKIKNIELEKEFGDIEVYGYKEFEYKEIEVCNFVCLTSQQICVKEFET